MNRDIRDMIRKAEAQGFRTQYRQNKVMVYGKDGVSMVLIHLTPSGGKRSIQNTRSDLRRIGVEL